MSHEADTRIGLLGAGRMGREMGRFLLRGGRSVAVYDPSADARAAVVELGAVECASAQEVAARTELVLVVVVDDAQVREAVAACLETARPGTILAICASVRPDTCRELADAGAAGDVHVIDAALVGGERGAEQGELVFYCGGDEAVVDRVRAACEPCTRAVVHVGAVGAGQVAKTANNILLWTNIRADVETMRLARALGVDLAKLRAAMELGSGDNRPLREWGRRTTS